MTSAGIAANPAHAAAARALVLDALARECVLALRAEGIRVILLKGPVTARWLYSGGDLRDYLDVDLLVARTEFQRASWALKRFGSTPAKLILVKGAPLELMKARQRRFYFDQGGTLVKRFGIRAVPASVEQQGRVLVITEQAVKPQERPSS